MKKILLFLATVAVAASCTKDIIDNATFDAEANDTKQITINASTDGAATRVNVSDDGAQGYTVEWKEDDCLGGWAWNGPYSNSTFNKFTIAEGGYGATNSVFEGEIKYTSDESTVRFIHPYTTTALNKSEAKDVVFDSGTYAKDFYYGFDIDLSNQNAGALNDNTYMISNTIDVAEIDNASLSLSHIGAMIELNFKALEGYTLTKVVVKDIPTVASIDLREEENFVTSTTDGDMTISVGSMLAPFDGIYTIAFNILPFTVTGGDALEVVSYYTKDGVSYSATTTINASNDVTFARATRNSVNVLVAECDLNEEEAPAVLTSTTITGDDFLSDNYASNDGEKIYQNITLQVANAYKNNSGIQLKSGVGLFYNTVALNGLAEISFEINSAATTNMPTIYVGETVSLTTSVNAVNGVCTIPAGCKYFRVVADNGYVVITKMTFTYESIAGQEPTVKSVAPTALAFVQEGETLTAEVSGTRLDEVELEAISDNDHFVASIDGTTLTVTAGENANEDKLTGTVTVRIAGETEGVEVAVSQVGTVVVAETLVASIVSADLASYVTSATVSSKYAFITYIEIADASKYNNSNAGKIQWRSSKGKIYNNTAIEGLSKIVVKGDLGALTVSYGSSEQPSTAIASTETADGTEFTIPAGSTYFLVANGSGVTYSGDVEIYAI